MGHELQQAPNSCLPACARTVLRHRGRESPTQAQMIASWSGSARGYSIGDAARELGVEVDFWNPLDPNLVSALRHHLGQGSWIVAQLFSSILREYYDRHPPPRLGPHGRLNDHLGVCTPSFSPAFREPISATSSPSMRQLGSRSR